MRIITGDVPKKVGELYDYLEAQKNFHKATEGMEYADGKVANEVVRWKGPGKTVVEILWLKDGFATVNIIYGDSYAVANNPALLDVDIFKAVFGGIASVRK